MKYRPLPFYLTIKESEIHGLGLYSLTEIPKDTTIGMTHIEIDNDIIRTPLGGFLNHSDNLFTHDKFIKKNTTSSKKFFTFNTIL